METRHLDSGWEEERPAEEALVDRKRARLAAWLFGATVVGLFLFQFLAQAGWSGSAAQTPPSHLADSDAESLLGAWRKASAGHPALGESAAMTMPSAGVFWADHNVLAPPPKPTSKNLGELHTRLNTSMPPKQ